MKLQWTNELPRSRFDPKMRPSDKKYFKVLNHTLNGPVTKETICAKIYNSRGVITDLSATTDINGIATFSATIENIDRGGFLKVLGRKKINSWTTNEAFGLRIMVAPGTTIPIPAETKDIDLGTIKMTMASTSEDKEIVEKLPGCDTNCESLYEDIPVTEENLCM